MVVGHCGAWQLYLEKKKKKKFRYQFRLVNAMHRNGPLTQVKMTKEDDKEIVTLPPYQSRKHPMFVNNSSPHAMDYFGFGVFFGHRRFLPIALANESSDCQGSIRNA